MSAAEVPPGEQGAPQPRVPEPGRQVSITSRYKNQQGLWLSETGNFQSPKQFLLKGLHKHLLAVSSSNEAPGT